MTKGEDRHDLGGRNNEQLKRQRRKRENKEITKGRKQNKMMMDGARDYDGWG